MRGVSHEEALVCVCLCVHGDVYFIEARVFVYPHTDRDFGCPRGVWVFPGPAFFWRKPNTTTHGPTSCRRSLLELEKVLFTCTSRTATLPSMPQQAS